MQNVYITVPKTLLCYYKVIRLNSNASFINESWFTYKLFLFNSIFVIYYDIISFLPGITYKEHIFGLELH